MSHETAIGSLSGGISDEDAKLVDSILNDINDTPEQPQQRPQGPLQGGPSGQGPSPEQQKMMAQRQQQMAMQQKMAMQQQQLQQQQEMAQQQMNQQQMGPGGPSNQKRPPNVVETNGPKSILDSIQTESKSILLIVMLSVLMNLDQVNQLFKYQPTLFVSEDGSLNMQSVLLKAIIIGLLFYVVKTKVF